MANYQDSSASRVSLSRIEQLVGKNVRQCRKPGTCKGMRERTPRTSWSWSRRRSSVGLLLLVLLSNFGVAQGSQATTDCQILIDWLPEIFNGTDIACCDQAGIKCNGGRITEMYVYILNRF
jgi:hypothetical protein